MTQPKLKVLQSNPFAAFDQLGYGGYKGAVGRVAVQPFLIPPEIADQIERVANALQRYFFAVNKLAIGPNRPFVDTMNHRVSDVIPRSHIRAPMQLFRPDMVWQGDCLFVTEAESAPGGHGFVAALQGEQSSLVEMYAHFLTHPKTGETKPFRVILTHRWGEYIFEQAYFCHRLARLGIDAKVIVDAPLDEVQRRANAEWQKQHGVHLVWDTHIRQRLADTGLLECVEFRNGLPNQLDSGTVVFLMGYARHWGKAGMDKLKQLERSQVRFINGANHIWSNKALLAAVKMPVVRQALLAEKDGGAVLQVLDDHICPTWMLQANPVTAARGKKERHLPQADVAGQTNHPWAASLDYLLSDAGRKELVLKEAGNSTGETDWGARSLRLGRDHRGDGENIDETWVGHITAALREQKPFVVQRLLHSKKFRVPYWELGPDGCVKVDDPEPQRLRLTPFVIASGGQVHVDYGLATFERNVKVHGGTASTTGCVAVSSQ